MEEEAVVGVEVAAPEGRRESQPLGYDWINRRCGPRLGSKTVLARQRRLQPPSTTVQKECLPVTASFISPYLTPR